MPSPTSRISIVAFSTLAALVAQELARTANVTPGTLASVPEPEDQKGVQPVALTNPELTQPVAQPETLSAKPFTNKAQKSNSTSGRVTKQSAQTLDLGGQLPAVAIPSSSRNLPAPLPPPKVDASVQKIDVNNLPIDAFVAASLKDSATQVQTSLAKSAGSGNGTQARANQPAKMALERSPKIASTLPVPSQANQSQPARTLPDIQNHRSQRAIEALLQRGVIHGSEDGTFRPDAPISDIEFKIMFRNAFQRSPEAVASIKRPSEVVTRADAAEFIYAQLQRGEAIAKAKELPTQAATSPTPDRATVAAPETLQPEKSSPRLVAQTVVEPQPERLISQPSRAFPPQQAMTTPAGIPATSLTPAQEDYTLGPGDRLKVEVFGVPEYSRDYQVSVNGNLKLYLVGDLRVQGLTLNQAEKAIGSRYARLLQRIKVDVTLTAPRPMNVAIAGEVSKPGSYSIASAEGAKFPTVTKLIQQAGGINQSANPGVVYVRRPQANGTNQLITVDLWDLFKTGNIRQDLVLRDGDMVFVPAADQINPADSAQLAAANFAANANQPLNVAVVGEVARPGPYVLSRGQSISGGSGGGNVTVGSEGGLLTVTQAIQQAGGITALADLRNVQIKRTTRSTAPQVITLNLWDMLQKGDLSQDLVLQQGDTITVPTATAVNPAEANQLGIASFAPSVIRVNVVGEVRSPGAVQVPPNTTLNQALLAAGGFDNKRAYKKTVELIRLNPNGTATRISIPVDLSRGIDEKNNPILRNNDIIIVNRSGLARFTDTLDTILGPVNRLLPLFLLGL